MGYPVANREIYNLSMVAGSVLFKTKGKSWIFILLGSTKRKKKETNYEIGQMLVSRALDDTKTIGKAGADIFVNFGPEKPSQKLEK